VLCSICSAVARPGGALVLGMGAASALLEILYALMENDLKRLLAYSSIENIGIIFIGVGAGLLFSI
jgi:hydrogenase-4 component B